MYRLYVDETGNADLKASDDPNHRYLSLTGVIMSMDLARDALFPRLEGMKAEFFAAHPDEPIVFHRKEMIGKSPPFHALQDDMVERDFNAALLALLTDLDYRVVTVVIDKLEHLRRYQKWSADPYHYCLEILIERYIHFLRNRGSRGDVMGEARGGKFDRRLEAAFSDLYQYGPGRISSAETQKRLTTKKLKLKPKTANVAGLQMVDMLAHPSACYVRSEYNAGAAPGNFGAQIVQILLNGKYRRNWQSEIHGYGIKWLP